MKLTIYLICIVLLAVCSQSIEAKHHKHGVRHRKSVEEQSCQNYALAKPDRDLRGIRDVWAKIRQIAIESWNCIKALAENVKEKINTFVENVKDHAIELKKQFEEKLVELKDKIYNIINDIYGTGELVKQCTQKEQENIDHILKEIMSKMSECIAKEISQLTKISSDKPQPLMNETQFFRELDERKNLCEREKENSQECVCEMREDIVKYFTVLESDIQKSNFEARNVANDVKGTLVTCSLNNLIDATNLISAEIVEIAKCVVEAKGNEAESSINNNNEIS